MATTSAMATRIASSTTPILSSVLSHLRTGLDVVNDKMPLFIFLGIITLLGLGITVSLRHTWPTSGRLPASLPWIGVQKGAFAKTRACLREWSAGLRTLADGYSQVSNQDHG